MDSDVSGDLEVNKTLLKRALSVLFLISVFGLASCLPSQKLAFFYVLDVSKSARESPDFMQDILTVCRALDDSVRRGDQALTIYASGKNPKYEDLKLAKPGQFSKDCRKDFSGELTELGTLTCKSWELVGRIAENVPYKPIFISQVHVNETEEPCPEVWQKTAEIITERGGYILILSSTNAGNSEYNSIITETFDKKDRVKFWSGDFERDVKNIISSLRKEQ